jgi:SIR2-like domain
MITDPVRNSRAQQGLISVLQTGRAVAVTGAGLSVWAGYPTWSELIIHLADAVRDRRGDEVNVDLIIQNNQNPLHCLQKLGAEMVQRSAFEEFIRAEFRPVSPRDPSVLRAFVNLPFHHILTLNFEESLERAHAALGRPAGSLSSANVYELVEFIRKMNEPSHPRQIVHLHGKVSDHQGNIVLTEDDYTRLYHGHTLFTKVLWLLVASRILVFFGFGFNDPDFVRSLEDAKRDIAVCGNCHYALIGLSPDDNDVAKRNHFHNSFLIEPIFYEVANNGDGRDHDGFSRLIRGISETLGIADAAAILPPAVPAVVPEARDLQIVEQLGERFIQRVDPGDIDVPR